MSQTQRGCYRCALYYFIIALHSVFLDAMHLHFKLGWSHFYPMTLNVLPLSGRLGEPEWIPLRTYRLESRKANSETDDRFEVKADLSLNSLPAITGVYQFISLLKHTVERFC